MTLYDEVQALAPGTVWHCGGDPWFRSARGVVDLMPYSIHEDGKIPENWMELDHPITIIHSPYEEC